MTPPVGKTLAPLPTDAAKREASRRNARRRFDMTRHVVRRRAARGSR